MRDGLTQHVPGVYRLALRLTGDRHRAEDLTQETFLRAWQRQQQLKDDKAAKAWLFRIAVNLSRDEFKRSASSNSRLATLPDDLRDTGPTPDRAAETRETFEQALKVLDALPPRQRTVLYLISVEGMSLSEVAEILEISVNTAKVNLSLARKRMREELQAKMPHAES